MFDRFTASARRTIVLSQDEARALKHDHVRPVHLLLGMLTAEQATACALLIPLGVDPEVARAEVVVLQGAGDTEPSGHIPFSADSKKALEHSLRESLALDHNYIGTEHILLGLLSEPCRETTEMLSALGVASDVVRKAVMARLGSAAGAEPAEP
jgi:ATP-dependent Clp protease ATP-binding subunit ClpC